MVRGRTYVLAGLTLVAIMASAGISEAQRSSSTETVRPAPVRTGPVTKADVLWTDVTCEIKAFKMGDMFSSPQEIPPGTSVSYWMADASPSNIFFKAYVHNRGNKRASFTTRMGIYKPPGPWKFVPYGKFSYTDVNGLSELPLEAYSVSLTLESHESRVIGPFVLMPIHGTHNFQAQAFTDAEAAVAEADESNNICRISISVTG